MKNPIIVSELRRLASEHGGVLKPEVVVDAARDADSPLHSQFEWDDDKAAHAHRLWQARILIGRVVVSYDAPSGKVEHQVFVSLSPDRAKGEGYRVMAEAMADEDMRAQLLADAKAEMLSFRHKYARLTELGAVFDAMLTAEHAIEARQPESVGA
jgi:hypothetical protein